MRALVSHSRVLVFDVKLHAPVLLVPLRFPCPAMLTHIAVMQSLYVRQLLDPVQVLAMWLQWEMVGSKPNSGFARFLFQMQPGTSCRAGPHAP